MGVQAGSLLALAGLVCAWYLGGVMPKFFGTIICCTHRGSNSEPRGARRGDMVDK